MTTLLRNRWLHRALIAGVLLALGIGIYQVQSPKPIWVIDAGNVEPISFLEGGRRFLTRPPLASEDFEDSLFGRFHVVPCACGPLQVWDCQTGAEVAHLIADQAVLSPFVLSDDGRFFAAEANTVEAKNEAKIIRSKSLLMVDIAAGMTKMVPLTGTTIASRLAFSLDGACLAHSRSGLNSIALLEPATGRVIGERDSAGIVFPVHTDEMVVHFVQANPLQYDFEVWNARANNQVALLEKVIPNFGVPSPDGRYLLLRRDLPHDRASFHWVIWSLEKHRVAGEFATERDDFEPKMQFSNDGSFLASLDEARRAVQIREVPSGKRIGKCPDGRVQRATFSPNGKLLAVIYHDREVTEHGGTWMTMVEIPSMKILWQKSIVHFHEDALFSGDSQVVFTMAGGPLGIHGLDCITGDTRVAVAMPTASQLNENSVNRRLTRDMGSMLILQSAGKQAIGGEIRRDNDFLVVLSLDTLWQRFRVAGVGTVSALLSDDGRTLVTAHDEGNGRRSLRCWDLDAWKPLHWAIGVPAGLAALLVLWALWRGKRRTLAANPVGT